MDIHTDSEPLVESIKSTKRVENKALCNEISAMKESLLYEEVRTFSYISTKENPADKLTKHTIETPIFYNIFIKGIFNQKDRKKYIQLMKREHAFEIRLIENKTWK